jgi:hypothetical protein
MLASLVDFCLSLDLSWESVFFVTEPPACLFFGVSQNVGEDVKCFFGINIGRDEKQKTQIPKNVQPQA